MTLSNDNLLQKLARPFRYYRTVDSTNDLAKTWLLQGAPEGAVVIADEQRRGRGRHGRLWHTPPGVALAFSMVLRPDEATLASVHMTGALGVYDLARKIGCDEVSIKWPNDVLVSGKKVSGLLVENVWESDILVGTVLGIGVNVRVDFQDTELRNSAISLESVTHCRLDRVQLICKLLQRIDHWNGVNTDDVLDTWKNRLNTLGKRVKVDGFTGVAFDVTPEGALLVKSDEGEIRQVNAGDVFTLSGGGSVR
ncbi:MAG: biotin--[acetyl-CoA-carboxylase] ligase [Chloroflexi bacterium]|nr:biotin--[acetyl-CoA-carboxylase] ligase [Chloroflexota bacterium]